MSAQPQPPQVVPCPACQASISFTSPAPVCINHLAFSQIIIVHERGIDCPACGAYFILGVGSAHLDYALVPAERPSGLVVPVLQFPKLVRGN